MMETRDLRVFGLMVKPEFTEVDEVNVQTFTVKQNNQIQERHYSLFSRQLPLSTILAYTLLQFWVQLVE